MNPVLKIWIQSDESLFWINHLDENIFNDSRILHYRFQLRVTQKLSLFPLCCQSHFVESCWWGWTDSGFGNRSVSSSIVFSCKFGHRYDFTNEIVKVSVTSVHAQFRIQHRLVRMTISRKSKCYAGVTTMAFQNYSIMRLKQRFVRLGYRCKPP